MVRKYIRKTNRGSWSEESMRKAILAVLDGKMGASKAAKTFSVPSTTLERKISIARQNNEVVVKQSLGPRSSVFSTEEEIELVEYLLDMERRLCGLTTKDLRTLVYQFAVNNNKTHPFNKDKCEAGSDWTMRFLNRHPEIIIKKSENTPTESIVSDKHDLNRFYELLDSMYAESARKNALTVANDPNSDKISN